MSEMVFIPFLVFFFSFRETWANREIIKNMIGAKIGNMAWWLREGVWYQIG